MADLHLAYRDETAGPDGQGTDVPLVVVHRAFRRQKVGQPIVISGFAEEIDRYASVIDWQSRMVVLPKPYGGVYHILQNRSTEGGNVLNQVFGARLERALRLARTAGSQGGQSGSTPRHSAPYSCSVLAERLLARARRMRASGPVSTETWVQIALLAGEAKEILGGLSLSTASEAVALQNEAEVQAELSFLGTSVQVLIEPRLDVLEREVEAIHTAGGLSPNDRGRGAAHAGRVNCLLKAVHNLRRRLSDEVQTEAAEECLRRSAAYARALEWRQLAAPPNLGGPSPEWARSQRPDMPDPPCFPRTAREALQFISRPYHWLSDLYMNFVTASGTSVVRLLGMSVAWAFVFALIYYHQLQGCPDLDKAGRPLDKSGRLAIEHSLLTFVLQPSISLLEQRFDDYSILKQSVGYCLVMLIELSIAYLHLGLLVSVLHRRLTRRAP
jgi:hypothetical protein